MRQKVRIGVIGDYDDSKSLHRAINAAIGHAAGGLSIDADILWIPTNLIDYNMAQAWPKRFDGILAAAGAPYATPQGAVEGIRIARETGLPFFGSGEALLQTIAEHMAANGNYTVPGKPDGNAVHDNGPATVLLEEGSLARRSYDKPETKERFDHTDGRITVSESVFNINGLRISGRTTDGTAGIIELADHPFFIATAFAPQSISTSERPHPLFLAFLAAALHFRGNAAA